MTSQPSQSEKLDQSKATGCPRKDEGAAAGHYPGLYVPALDGLRAIAISKVVIYHYFAVSSSAWPVESFLGHLAAATTFFWAGVDLFFVLSGFLVATTLIGDTGTQYPLRQFYIRRFYRIVPLYLIALVAAFLISVQSGVNQNLPLTTGNFPAWMYLLMVQNFGVTEEGFGGLWLAPTWSLAVEEQFYMLLPLLMVRLGQRPLLLAVATLIVVAPFMRLLHLFPEDYVLPYCRADALFLGVLLAIGWADPAVRVTLVRRRKEVRAAALLGVVGIIAMGIWQPQAGGVWNHAVMALGYCLVMLSILTRAIPIVNDALSVRWVRWIGKRAYPIYLFHYGTLALIFSCMGAPLLLNSGFSWWLTGVSLATTLLVSDFLHRFVEKPLHERGRVVAGNLGIARLVAGRGVGC